MKKYDEYKDSGVEWIGKVPSHWEACRFKDFMKLQTDASMAENKIGLENIESKSGKFIETSTEFEGNGTAFAENDIVYGKLRPYLQKVWLAEFEGNAVGDFFVFKAKENSVPTFIKYLLLSDGFTKEADGSTVGAKMPRVSSNFILTMHYCLPPLSEQNAIATYLGKKCGEIDKIISTQQKRISLLQELKQSVITHAVTKGLNPNVEMKDSGVEWIGEVPKHWEVAPIKRYVDIFTGNTPSTKEEKYYNSEDINWFTPGDFELDELKDSEKKISEIARKEKACRMFPAKSVYMIGIGGTIGKIAYCDEVASANQQINILIPHKDTDYKYLAYCLKSQKDEIVLAANIVTLPIINQDKTGYLNMPHPDKKEQHAIATYLDKKCASIDSSISKAQHQVELLQEYKQSLITEVVTGKRKVC